MIIENGIPHGAAMGAINGTNIESIKERLDSMLSSPAGVIPFGSIGTHWNGGNRGNTYFHDPKTGETVNSEGLPEIGIDAAEPLISEYSHKARDRGKYLLVGITPLRGQNASEVLPELGERVLNAGADRFEVNYSCPNIVMADGGRKPILGYDPEAMMITRAAIVNRIGSSTPFREKLPPYVGEYSKIIPEITATYRAEKRLGNVAITGFNTIPNVTLERLGKPVLRIIADVDGKEVITHAGGLSGPVVAEMYQQLQNDFLAHLPDDIDFIATGGIGNGQDIRNRMNDSRVIATMTVTRFWEGEKAGISYGRTATKFAEEYSETQ